MAQLKMAQLNLLVHGTWGVEENAPKDGQPAIRLVTVPNMHHVFKAGYHDNPQFDLLEHGKKYRLTGVATDPTPHEFDPNRNATIDVNIDLAALPEGVKSQTPPELHADEGKAAVIIDLPNPREIHSIRRAATDEQLFRPIPRTPKEMSITGVLVYDVPDLSQVKLEALDKAEAFSLKDLGVDAKTIDGTDVANLHVFADPDKVLIKEVIAHDAMAEKDGSEPHFVETFRTLGEAFGLSLTALSLMNIRPAIEESILGLVDKCDTTALFEMCARTAVSPANCERMIVNNRTGGS